MTTAKRFGFLATLLALLALVAGLACDGSKDSTGPGDDGGPDPVGDAPVDWGLTVVARPFGGWGYAVWALSPDLAYAGAEEDVLIWDGSTWQPELHVTGLFVQDMFALGPNAVYAVGTHLYRYDGSTWTDMGLPGTCWSVWGSAEDDLWACGNATVHHWDGAAWTTMSVGSYTLWALWGTGPDDVFLVGNGGEIFHWDGAAWSPMTSGTTSNLWDVWGFAANDVWVAGPAGGVLHYDGNVWSTVPSETAARSLWGSAANDLWAIDGNASLMHWDGSAWGASIDLDALGLQSLGGSGGTLFAAGNSLGMMEDGHWTRQLWTFDESFAAIGGSAATNLVATAGRYFLYWEGNAWSMELLSALPSPARVVWTGAPTQDVVSCYGTIAYRNGSVWQYLNIGTNSPTCAWGTAAGGVWLACNNGRLYHTDGNTTPALTQTTVNYDLWGIHGLADDAIWAVGRAGTLLHFDGASWSEQDSATPFDLLAVWAAADDDLWVAGDNGVCRHWNGATWTDHDFTGLDINQLLGWASDGILAVGDGGLFRWDGSAWTAVPTGDVFDIEAVHLAPDGSTLAYDQAGWLYMGLPD